MMMCIMSTIIIVTGIVITSIVATIISIITNIIKSTMGIIVIATDTTRHITDIIRAIVAIMNIGITSPIAGTMFIVTTMQIATVVSMMTSIAIEMVTKTEITATIRATMLGQGTINRFQSDTFNGCAIHRERYSKSSSSSKTELLAMPSP